VADLDEEDNSDTSGIQEVKPWNPMKALKDVEIGDFYFKRKNYRAALDRYKESSLLQRQRRDGQFAARRVSGEKWATKPKPANTTSNI